MALALGVGVLGVALLAYALGHAIGRDAGIAHMSARWMELHGLIQHTDDWQGEGNTRPGWRVK